MTCFDNKLIVRLSSLLGIQTISTLYTDVASSTTTTTTITTTTTKMTSNSNNNHNDYYCCAKNNNNIIKNENDTDTDTDSTDTESTNTDSSYAYSLLGEDNCHNHARKKKKKKNKNKKSVSFDRIKNVRTYNLIMGDHPKVKYPLSLGWSYHDEEVTIGPIQQPPSPPKINDDNDQDDNKLEFQNIAPTQPSQPQQPQQQQYPNHLSAEERFCKLLLTAGYAKHNLRHLERQRKIQLALEYVKGHDSHHNDKCCTLYQYDKKFINRYILI